MNAFTQWLLIWLAVTSLVAVVMTLWDKHRAKKSRWRVPERTLLLVAAVGGAAAMLLAMRLIHHKTRHRKFMWGLPLLVILHIALLVWFWYSGWLSV